MIRSAELTDAKEVIPLIMIILKDMELGFLMKHGEDKVSEVLHKGFINPDFRYSHKRAIVLEDGDEVVGVAYGYHESEEAIIDEPLKAILKTSGISESEKMFEDKEAFPDEWYLDSIAVRSDQRGKGVGVRLLDALPKFAKEQGADKIGLSVDKVNHRAKKLYLRQGFEKVGTAVISGHSYDHMQKEIN